MIKLFRRLRLPLTLDAKMMYMLLLSFLGALAVYFSVYGLATLALNKIYMSPASVAARQAEIYADFNAFVSANKISGQDEAAVARWSGNNPYVTILIYKDEDLNLRVFNGRAQNPAAMQPSERLRYSGQYGKLYPMRFADGVYAISIGDSSQVREDNVNRVIALVLGSVAFVAIMLWYVRRLTRRIIRLSREADAIGDGDLEAPITLGGEDEVSMLATEMDAMRHSVIDRMSGERRAWEANSELITAISHDIRTPMTALIGYLGLMNDEGLSQEERASFSASAYDKAMELKDLTDELFKYFLVFGKAQLDLNQEELDGRMLLEQMLAETQFELADFGFTVQNIPFEGECRVKVDPLYLKRVLDNLVSNAKKYADREQPIVFLSELKDGELSVCVSNRVARSMDRVESTKIGLRTCEKIMAAMSGRFEIQRDAEHFAATFVLPTVGQ